MNAVGKTLGSLVVALIGLLVYLGIVVGALLKVGTGAAVFLGLALTLVGFIVLLMMTLMPDEA